MVIKLTERKSHILHLVIKEYIKNGNPVSSKLLCEKYKPGYSSATIRNDLATLEKKGYLTHPYTSAGRIPTDEGYRYYIKDLMEIQRLTHEEERRIKNEFNNQMIELDKVMHQTSKMLAMVSECSGFTMAPNLTESLVEYIELTKIGTNKLLVLMVTEEGLVKHRIIQCSEDLTQIKIKQISKIINKRLHGKKISEVKKNILNILETEKYEQELIFNIAQDLTNELFNLVDENNFFFEESPNFLGNVDIDEETYELVKQKEVMHNILENVKNTKQGVKILIGNDSPLKNCSLITSAYKLGENSVGVLGIIGPKRMKYSKMVSLVDYISKMFDK
ncbi:MAG: heat-inducible transcription repressor HrcA [bacterium]|nr:heat-inducible transcription repressor HrcA [bacterium]